MNALRQLKDYPSAIAGLGMIAFLILLCFYAVITIPYQEAIRHWRASESEVGSNPRNARPVWSNWLSGTKLNPNIIIDTTLDAVEIEKLELSEEIDEKIITYTFDYDYDEEPPELTFFLTSEYDEKSPFVEFTWITPDGREISAGDVTSKREEIYRPSLNDRVMRRVDESSAEKAFFYEPGTENVVKGEYTVRINALLFEENSDVESEMVIYGRVFGWAGTDHLRRDLSVALLWGTPIAMSFGLIATILITMSTMTIAAIGVWYGGWLDAVIQRIAEVNLILPLLPILIMIGTLYSRSIWVILGTVIILGLFGGGAIKNYRSIFLQVREMPYIEAAQSYGANSSRLIFRYLIPRVIPLIIPSLVSGVPAFVFLEAALAVLNLGDPILPTWGKVISDANSQGALFNGYYYWILEPAGLLMLTGIAFALVGFALDRVFNPRLREV